MSQVSILYARMTARTHMQTHEQFAVCSNLYLSTQQILKSISSSPNAWSK